MINREQVQKWWQNCKIVDRKRAVVNEAANVAMTYKSNYEEAGTPLAIPWYVIAGLHMRESNFNFNTYLGNGDPLFNHIGQPVKSVHVPAGRGPFIDWAQGAEDALTLDGWNYVRNWDIVSALMQAEIFNGLGYSHRGLPSPYVWSDTNIQVAGKYVRDGVWSPAAWDTQPGVASLWLALRDEHGVDLGES